MRSKIDLVSGYERFGPILRSWYAMYQQVLGLAEKYSNQELFFVKVCAVGVLPPPIPLGGDGRESATLAFLVSAP